MLTKRLSSGTRLVVLVWALLACQPDLSGQQGTQEANASRERTLSAQSVLGASQAASSPPSALQTAWITAIGALVGVVLKDLIFAVFAERRKEGKELAEVFSKYADPLASACVALMWRLHEILEQPGRGRFLRLVGVPPSTNKYSTFGAYKKLSTLYRVASLLGWIRACRREFSYLKIASIGQLQPVETAIANFESALADGPAVEVERVSKLCELWQIPLPQDTSNASSVAVEIEAVMDDFMQACDQSEIALLRTEQLSELVRLTSVALADGLSATRITDTVLSETVGRARHILDIKEAWIYRDWQAAIGDLMITTVANANRRFEVIGFSEFESMYHAGTPEQQKWMRRLEAVFDGIDVSKADPYDHRRIQISAVFRACACLTQALMDCTRSTAITARSLDLSRSILKKGKATS